MQIIEDRRALHRIPELDRELPQTVAYLRRALAPLRCSLHAPIPGSLCAYFDFGRDHAIAFRSDADALPVTERTGLPYASRHEGRMHACGHDAHMAMVLELARWLDGQTDLPHNVLLVFQPAEETTGGARDLCRSGIFTRFGVKTIFGMHLWPDLPAGVIASRRGAMMSRSCELTVELWGKSAHIAKASEGIDALRAGVEFYRRAMELTASLPPDVRRLCHFGQMESGTVRNAVSGYTRLAGSLRAFDDGVFTALQDGLRGLGEQVARQSGCTVRVTMNDGYPAVVNPPALYDRVRRCGVAFEPLAEPVLITEDFSYYQRALDGMFFFLGVGPAPALHADNFCFEEAVLPVGASFFQTLAQNFRQFA